MTTENDALEGGEGISIDEAAQRFAAATSNAVPEDHAEDEDAEQGETTEDDAELSDDDVGAEDVDGDSGEEDQAEDDQEEPQTDLGRFVADNAKVRLDDGSVVSIADLKKGSLLHADYTRKTQEVAEQRRSVEGQSERIKATETELQQRMEYVSGLLQSVVPPPPDPAMLQSDPLGYMSQKAQHEQWVTHLNYMQAEQQRILEERQAQTAQQQNETAQREWEALIAKVPEFRDQKRVDRFVTDLKEQATSLYGFKPEELRAVALDHRQALVLKDALAWRKLQASKPKVPQKVEGRPPVQKGGKRLTPDAQKARAESAAKDRLKRSGRLDDAVAAYLATQKG